MWTSTRSTKRRSSSYKSMISTLPCRLMGLWDKTPCRCMQCGQGMRTAVWSSRYVPLAHRRGQRWPSTAGRCAACRRGSESSRRRREKRVDSGSGKKCVPCVPVPVRSAASKSVRSGSSRPLCVWRRRRGPRRSHLKILRRRRRLARSNRAEADTCLSMARSERAVGAQWARGV